MTLDRIAESIGTIEESQEETKSDKVRDDDPDLERGRETEYDGGW